MPGLQELYHQHPVAFLGIVGGGALAAAYVVSQRGKSTSAVTPYPVAGYGIQGAGYGLPGPPAVPGTLPCSATGDCPEPAPASPGHPGPFPRTGPGTDPCGGPLAYLNPACAPSTRMHPGPLPRPGGSGGGGYGGGFGMSDYDYMRSYVDAKQRVNMRIGLGV